MLEGLHYHCSHNPKYIQDIRNALRETGMLDETARTVHLRLKDSFKQTSLYESEYIWTNDRVRNPRDNVDGLDAYKIEGTFTYLNLMTGQVTEASAFGGGQLTLKPSSKEPISRDFKLADFGRAILGFALDANDFFHFANLRTYFPQLASASQFVTSDSYLANVTVNVRGLPDDLDNLTARQKLDIAHYVLHQIESGVKRESVEFIGTKEWHAYDDSYGTDQEKLFIKYMHDQEARLRGVYDDFYLLRNEKAVKLYDFDTGRAFEPDFILFLRKKGKKASTIMQLFIEPKGDQLRPQDDWKQVLLEEVKNKARLETVFQGRDYSVLGLPFYNEAGQTNAEFKEAFEDEVLG